MLDVPQVFMILGQICAIAEVHEVKFVFTVQALPESLGCDWYLCMVVASAISHRLL